MNKRYKGIENITAEHKAQATGCFNRWKLSRHNPNKQDIKALFDLYHEYVYKSPSDMACPSCVQFIYDYWHSVVANWTEAETTD